MSEKDLKIFLDLKGRVHALESVYIKTLHPKTLSPYEYLCTTVEVIYHC